MIRQISMDKAFSIRKENTSEVKPKRLSVEDGFKTAHLTRIIKSLEFVFLVTNCLGFSLLVLTDIFSSNWLQSRLKYCFTYLMLVQLSLEVLMTHLRQKRQEEEEVTHSNKSPQGSSRQPNKPTAAPPVLSTVKQTVDLIIEFIPKLFRLHVLLIFVQPCVIWPDDVNTYLQRLTSARIYILLRFYLTNNEIENARFKRLLRAFGSGFGLISGKIAVSKNYPVTVCWIAVFLIFGLGTIVNESVGDSVLENFLSTAYYVMISITTVGYGQIGVKDSDNRFVAALIIVIGICVNSLLTVTVLQAFSMTKQQDNAYYLRQRLELIEQQKDYVSDRLALLLDLVEMEDKLKETLTEEQKNSLDLKEQCLKNQLQGLHFRNLTGQVRQLMFQQLIDSKELSCQKVIRKHDQYKEMIDMYNDQRDVVTELRSQMDRLYSCNPVSGSNMDNYISKIKNRVRALKYKNNVLNQLVED